jgi:hypothetical protein
MLDESVKITKALLGDGDAREAIASWGKACERSLKRSFEATRGISETALKAHREMIEAAGRCSAPSLKRGRDCEGIVVRD